MEGFFSNGAFMFSLFISLIGLVMIVSALVSMYKARKTEFWRQATGKVLESDVAKNIRTTGGNTSTTIYNPEICYSYQSVPSCSPISAGISEASAAHRERYVILRARPLSVVVIENTLLFFRRGCGPGGCADARCHVEAGGVRTFPCKGKDLPGG